MEFYCEKAVWKVLPSLRRTLCELLIKKGAKRKEIARILCISEAAVSQYLNNKRGSRLRLSKNELIKIDKIAERILKSYRKGKRISKKSLARDFCIICRLLKNKV
ncbi:MAG: hypothetical protein QXJ96_03140 [Candidatus Aenigmatarchaeota archaeon]